MMIGRRATLSEVCSALRRVFEDEFSSYDEARGFHAPLDDVGPLISRGADNRAIAAVALSGWKPREVADRLRDVVGNRYVHFNMPDVDEMLDRVLYERHLANVRQDPTTVLVDRLSGEVMWP